VFDVLRDVSGVFHPFNILYNPIPWGFHKY
jgi:hypothetical protein